MILFDDVEKPSIDERKYRHLKLDNDLEVLLISDKDTEKAAAALDVHVGQMCDPIECQGLAHFLEHLLFMGTKKYPVENDYSEYLSAHGGHSNAFTGLENTNYYFEVNQEFLEGALDRFAQFFLEPLFLESSTEREMNAVNSEHMKNIQQDAWRLHQLQRDLADPNHPYSKFGTGNLETLGEGPKQNGIEIRKVLLDFHKKYYSANIMRLVVLGKEPLDILTEWVVSRFSLVANKNIQVPSCVGHPLGTDQLGKVLFVKPVKDVRQLSLTFAFPDSEQHYLEKPEAYLSHLVGHESAGSILSVLKKKGWAMGLSSYGGSGGKNFDFFKVSIELTEEGEARYEEIIDICFQYFKMIKSAGAQEWVFKETQSLSQLNFRFKEKSRPSSYCSYVAGCMHKYKKEHILSGPTLLWEFDRALIEQYNNYLRPDNFYAMLVSQSFDSTNWQKARYYGTEYKLCEFSDSLKKRLNDNSTIDAEIHLPHINDFVPSNFEVEKPLREVADYAELIMDTDKVRLWHKKDDTFFVPKAYTRFLLRSPLAYATPLQAVKCELYHKLLVDELNELSYFADIAGLKYDFTNTSDGMMLTVEGYNHKLGVLLQKVSEHLKNLEVKPERFNLIKEKLTRSLKNFKFNEPYHLSGYYISYVSQDFVWTYEEKLDCIDQIDVNSLNALIKEMYNNSHIEGFVHGNIDKEESIKLVEILTSALGFRPLPSLIRFSTSRSHILPQGSNTIFKECAGNPENLNSSIEYYIEIGDYDDVTLKAKSSLFSTIMTEPCFDQMRTKEQLGYIVFGGSRNQKGRLGYRILIQSEREAIFLETRVEAFIRKMECILNDLTETEFQKFIDVTVAQLLEKDKNLKQEFSRLWSHIKNHYYDFHRRKLEVEILKKLTKQEIIDFYKEYISIESKNRRKLSAWIESQVKKEEICKNNYSEEEKKEIQKILEKNVILVGLENVANFKKGLRLEKSPMPVQGVWMSKL